MTRLHTILASAMIPAMSIAIASSASAQTVNALAPLGEPLTFNQTRTELRGGMTFRSFDIIYPGKRLLLTTYTYPDGKLEQYLIAPTE